MKNYKNFNVGDKVIITFHPKNKDKTGVITEVRPSFCKIQIEGKSYNHTYGQFKKI